MAPAGSALGIVGRADDAAVLLEAGKDLLVPPHMVARGHEIHSGGEKFVQGLAGHANAPGNILPVGKHRIKAQVFLQLGQELLHGKPPGLAHNIT